MTQLIIFSLLNSVLYGMLLFLLASGLKLIFSMMGVLNIAHASFYMIGAYLGFQITRLVGFWPALVLAPLLVGAMGAVVERFGLRRVHPYGHIAELLFTFGLAFIVEELVQLVWGRTPVDYRIPSSLDFTGFSVLGTSYPAYRVFVFGVAIVVFFLLWLLLAKTRIGLIVRASLAQPGMVGMLGHNVPRIFMLVFGIGSALAGLAGVIAGPLFVTAPTMADTYGPILFVIIVVGGLGSLPGALIASLLIGTVQTFAVSLDVSIAGILAHLGISPPAGVFDELWNVTVAQVAPVLPYLLMVVLLIFRPTGLFGRRA